MLTLWHNDSAVCAAKVRMTLAEKNLPWESRALDLTAGEQFAPSYIALNPNAVVPTLQHDGVTITESTVINEYLDEAFPATPLRPADASGRARMRQWTKREDTIHDAINTMTATILFRHDLMQKSPAERAARYDRMPDPAKREKWRRMMEDGLDSPLVGEALVRFARLFMDMERTLATSPWLAGPDYSLADIGFLSFFYRLDLLECAGLWRAHFPHVTDWLARSMARPAFALAIRDPISQAAKEKYRAVAAPLRGKVEAQFVKALALAQPVVKAA